MASQRPAAERAVSGILGDLQKLRPADEPRPSAPDPKPPPPSAAAQDRADTPPTDGGAGTAAVAAPVAAEVDASAPRPQTPQRPPATSRRSRRTDHQDEPATPPVRTQRAPTVRVTQAVADEIRDAVVFLRSHGDPMATVTGFVDVAARRELDRLKKQYRIDEFPVSDVVFPPGRVAGR